MTFEPPTTEQLLAFHTSHFQGPLPSTSLSYNFCHQCNDWRPILGPYSSICSFCGSTEVELDNGEYEGDEVAEPTKGTKQKIQFELTEEAIAMFRQGAQYRKEREKERARQEAEEMKREAEEVGLDRNSNVADKRPQRENLEALNN